jgi:superfamily I DNA and RNA helicase
LRVASRARAASTIFPQMIFASLGFSIRKSEGGLLAESVYRFKGQSAPAVIFTEIDFEQIDELVFRKLFVGMTRARLKLVLSEGAAERLLDRI